MPKGVYQRPEDLGVRISEGKSPGSIGRKVQVRDLYMEGAPPKAIAEQMGLSVSTVKGWIVDLPKHSTGFSRRPFGQRAARVARLTGREGEAIRQEMDDKEFDPCVFCGSYVFEAKGWLGSAFHHDDDGCVDHAHKGCNATRRHARS